MVTPTVDGIDLFKIPSRSISGTEAGPPIRDLRPPERSDGQLDTVRSTGNSSSHGSRNDATRSCRQTA